MKKIGMVGAAIAAVSIAACSSTETNAPSSELALTMASAYASVPAGYSELNSSYVGDAGGPFQPEFGRFGDGGGGGRGHHGLGGIGGIAGFGLGFMGGGLFGGFWGDDFGFGFIPLEHACVYASGIVTCGPTTRNGITATRTIKFQTAAGVAQSAFDTSTTNTVTTTANVSGTITRRDSSKSTISSTSNQTVTGLTTAQRTVNSTSASSESSTGTTRENAAFTAKRTAGDTVKAVVIPKAATTNARPYPTAGQIIRAMSATVTISGQTPTTSTRREVITYDGSATAKVVITQDGTTQNCTLPLPHGRLACQ